MTNDTTQAWLIRLKISVADIFPSSENEQQRRPQTAQTNRTMARHVKYVVHGSTFHRHVITVLSSNLIISSFSRGLMSYQWVVDTREKNVKMLGICICHPHTLDNIEGADRMPEFMVAAGVSWSTSKQEEVFGKQQGLIFCSCLMCLSGTTTNDFKMYQFTYSNSTKWSI